MLLVIFIIASIKVILLMDDGIGSGLLIYGQSWDALVDGENVNRWPKTTPTIPMASPVNYRV